MRRGAARNSAQRDPARSREDILDAATEEFAEKGLSDGAVSVSRLGLVAFYAGAESCYLHGAIRIAMPAGKHCDGEYTEQGQCADQYRSSNPTPRGSHRQQCAQ